jgi:hypothetical protein
LIFVLAILSDAPEGTPFFYGDDPHDMTAHVSPLNNKPFALIGDFAFPHKYIALVDLHGLMGALRTLELNPAVDLKAKGIVRDVSVH